MFHPNNTFLYQSGQQGFSGCQNIIPRQCDSQFYGNPITSSQQSSLLPNYYQYPQQSIYSPAQTQYHTEQFADAVADNQKATEDLYNLVQSMDSNKTQILAEIKNQIVENSVEIKNQISELRNSLEALHQKVTAIDRGISNVVRDNREHIYHNQMVNHQQGSQNMNPSKIFPNQHHNGGELNTTNGYRAIHLTGFAQTVSDERIFQILQQLGNITSLQRITATSIRAIFSSPREADAALATIAGNPQFKSQISPALRVQRWIDMGKSIQGQEFIGSEAHKRILPFHLGQTGSQSSTGTWSLGARFISQPKAVVLGPRPAPPQVNPPPVGRGRGGHPPCDPRTSAGPNNVPVRPNLTTQRSEVPHPQRGPPTTTNRGPPFQRFMDAQNGQQPEIGQRDKMSQIPPMPVSRISSTPLPPLRRMVEFAGEDVHRVVSMTPTNNSGPSQPPGTTITAPTQASDGRLSNLPDRSPSGTDSGGNGCSQGQLPPTPEAQTANISSGRLSAGNMVPNLASNRSSSNIATQSEEGPEGDDGCNLHSPDNLVSRRTLQTSESQASQALEEVGEAISGDLIVDASEQMGAGKQYHTQPNTPNEESSEVSHSPSSGSLSPQTAANVTVPLAQTDQQLITGQTLQNEDPLITSTAPIREGRGGASGEILNVLTGYSGNSPLTSSEWAAIDELYEEVHGLYKPSKNKLRAMLRSRWPQCELLSTDGDGNCLPRAIVETCRTGFKCFKVLKSRTLEYVQEEEANLQHIFTSMNRPVDFAHVKDHLQTDGNYGDFQAVQVYSMFLRKPIRLWDSQTGEHFADFEPPGTSLGDCSTFIEMGYLPEGRIIFDRGLNNVGKTPGHYDAIKLCRRNPQRGNGGWSALDRQ